VLSEIATVDGNAVAPRVTPMLFSLRWAPRSTTTVPVHWVAHQVVVALPSIALAAGCSLAVELAVAVAPKATLTLRGAALRVAGADAWDGDPESLAAPSRATTVMPASAICNVVLLLP
jgi:hypothetical protein